MGRNVIYEKIRGGLAEMLQVDIDEIAAGTQLVADLGIDSLDVVELVIKAEGEFGISISDEEISSLVTVEDAVNLISSLIEISETEKEKKQAEADCEMKSLGPAAYVWHSMEEKTASEYIARTGRPYFIYDGQPSRYDEEYEKALFRDIEEARKEERYDAWLLKKISWYLGRDTRKFDIDTAAAVFAQYRIIEELDGSRIFGGNGSRFANGCHLAVTPDGVRHEMSEMCLCGRILKQELLHHCLDTIWKEPVDLVRTDRKGATTGCTAYPDSIYFLGGYLTVSPVKPVKKGSRCSSMMINAYTGEWSSSDGRYRYNTSNAASSIVYGKVNTLFRKLADRTDQEYILGMLSYRLGTDAKSISRALLKKTLQLNSQCSKLCRSGEQVILRDGRTSSPVNLLNPSYALAKEMISWLIRKEGYIFNLSVDGRKFGFVPYRFFSWDIKKRSVALKGLLFGDAPVTSEIFDLSLSGKKSYRARYDVLDVIHIKGDVEMSPDSHTLEYISKLTALLDGAFGAE